MKKLIVLTFVFLAIVLFAKPWTVMVYIGADNNLSEVVNSDVDEMESAGSSANLDIVCQIDGKVGGWGGTGYDDYLGDSWATVRRYHIQNGSSSNGSIDAGFIADLGELNSEDPDVLRDFVFWASDNYPADRYMLVLWNHGGGWEKGDMASKAIVWDDTNGDGSGINFSNGEYADVLSEIREYIGKSIAIVGFDACIVGLLEAEYETMGYGDYLVHSEANVPGDGWDYGFLSELSADPNASEEQVITWIIDYYEDEYGSDVTMSGLRLDHDHVDYQMAVNEFACQLIIEGGKTNASITSAISAACDFGSSLVDVWDFADEVDARNIGGAGSELDNASQALKNVYGYPIPGEGKPLILNYQADYTGACGTMAYTPISSYSSSWGNLDFAECNLWKEFISGSTSLPSVKLAYWGNSPGKYIETGTPTDVTVNARNLGSGTAGSVTAILSSYDSRVTITGSPVSFGSIGAGTIAASSTPFHVTVSPSVSDSSFIPFEIAFSTGKTAKFILTAIGEVNYPPDDVTLDTPFNFARVAEVNPILQWHVPNDPESNPLHFQVQWDTEPNFSSPTTISSEDNPNGFTPTVPCFAGSGDCGYLIGSQGEGVLMNGQTYWWRVRAKDAFSYSLWSVTSSFTVDNSLSAFDWHQTTDEQFLDDDISNLRVNGNQVTIQGTATIIDDDMEYASESDAWAVWDTYDGGTNVELTLEDRRYVSTTNSLRIRDRNSSAYAGAWRTFEAIQSGVAGVWAKIYNPELNDAMEFLGIHDGSAYSSSFSTGIVVYAKADTLKYWDGSGHVIHTSMDSLWHHYEIEFDAGAGQSVLYVDGENCGTFAAGGISQFSMLALGSKIIGNSANGTAYWDDFLLSSTSVADSGIIIGKAVAYSWHPGSAMSWGHVCWNQNTGDSIRIYVEYNSGAGWTAYISRFATGSSGIIDISPLGTADSVRLIGILYSRGEELPMPVLYDWTVDWNTTVKATDLIHKPRNLVIHSNSPNPFNPVTCISFESPAKCEVEVAVYNIKGEVVFTEQKDYPAGNNSIIFDGSNLPTGIYFCRIQANKEIVEHRMLMLK